jgi:CheY-like chemotaxis protein
MVPTGSFVPKTVKILLAEDNPVNQEVICEMLISIGCQVQVVSNGQQAIDALNHESYDMIFMDCQMPVMDGHEAARRIRSLEQQKGSIFLLSELPDELCGIIMKKVKKPAWMIFLTNLSPLNNSKPLFFAGLVFIHRTAPKNMEKQNFQINPLPCLFPLATALIAWI